MSTSGGQPGNNNAAKGKMWTDAIKRALARRSDTVEGGLNDLADTFIEAVANGDAWAMRELGDRLEGKPAQTTVHEGGENPIVVRKEAHFVSPSSD